MRNRTFVAAAIAALAFVPGAMAASAEQPISHYKGKPAENLSEAVKNFSEYNAKLETLLQGDVTDAEMADVHKLTYSLENALGKINEELTKLGETLEKLHVASEKLDQKAVIQHGGEYLSVSRQIVK